jgi:hypothetical protein
METNIINKSFFAYEGKDLSRLDAEFAVPSLLLEEQALKAHTGGRLKEFITKYNGPTINDSYAEEDDEVKYIAIDSIDNEDGLTYSDTLLFKDIPSRAKYKLVSGDILVSNVRPNRGAVTLITDRNSGNLASSGFTLLRAIKAPKFSQEFLFAFIKTQYGKKQLMRRNRGSMYPAVVEADVLDIWIPQPEEVFEKAITKQIKSILELHDEFFRLIESQEAMLEELLRPYGAPPSPLEGAPGIISTTVTSSKDFLSPEGPERFDAEFFRKEYDEFDALTKRLGDSFILNQYFDCLPGRALGGGEDLIPYIKQAVLTNAGINWSAVSYEQGDSTPETGRVKDGDILLASTAHEIYYVGRKVDYVRAVPGEIKDTNACVPDVMIVRSKASKPERLHASYVAAFLRNPAGLHQVQRCIRGLRGGHIYGRDVGQYVRVPIPDDDWLDEFEDVSEKAESRRNTAKTKFRSAIEQTGEWVRSIIGASESLEVESFQY